MTDVDELMTRMTIEEKCAQLGCVWFSALMANGKFAPNRLELCANGIGQIARIASESSSEPKPLAELSNRIQRFLVEETRLGIPAVIHEESTGGFCARKATQFPHGISLAATWDPELVERVAEAIGRQLRAVGARMTLAPVVDIARDPAGAGSKRRTAKIRSWPAERASGTYAGCNLRA